MIPPSTERARHILVAALDHDPVDRAPFLSTACEGDTTLLEEVRALLAAHDAAPEGFLDSPAASGDAADALNVTVKGDPRLTPKRPGIMSNEQSGDHIGPYKLLQQIGEGGFGAVWMADQEKPVRRRVALKIIKLGMDTKEIVARFEQERQALAMMDHPNIARVFDAGATELGRPFFAMELVRGVKITDYCDQQGLCNEERIRLFIEVCQAVQHAHQKGVIHRDLKPSNILVTVNDGKPVPKVIDFGVAKATQGRLTDGTLFTQFEQMIGTPLYMSPEQAEMTSLDVDTRSDIYSLGVLLYELLTGTTPIDTKTMAKAGIGEMRRLIREADPPRPSHRLKTLDGNELTSAAKRRHTEATRLPGALRGDVDWIVMKCLEKDRQRRYDTANGLALDLQRHLKNEVITARPPTTAYLLSKLIRRNKVAVAAGLAIAASLVIGIAASVWQAVRANRALDELRASAPAFASQARSLAAKEQFGEAIEKLDYAIKLRPDVPQYLVAKADLLQCQFKLADAAKVYREALRVQPGSKDAEASAKLCDDLLAAAPGPDGQLSHESLGKLHLAMQKQQRPAAELLPAARLLGAEREHLVAYWLDRLKDLPISPEKPLKDRLTVLEDDLLELDLKDTQITDLAVLAGMPLGRLTLWHCRQISDFTPLREFRSLSYLDVEDTQIADLTVLRGLPLEELYVGGTKISDLSPLRGMKLKALELYNCRLVSDLSPLEALPLTSFYARDLASGTDFSPLKRLPLEKCVIAEPYVTDLSFLANTPLKELGLYNCKNLRGLNWLNELKSLERLVLPGSYRNLPADDLQAIAALRKHPRLAFLQSDEGSAGGYSAWRLFQVTQSKDIFWRDWDREQTFLPAIRATGFDFSLTKLPVDSYRLRIQKQPLRDLSILKNAPISELYIGGTKITDLSPIADLPLRLLEFSETAITDLRPLRNMRLEELILGRGAVADLSLLAKMPLRRLNMHQCKAVGDLSPILKLQALQSLTVPVTARNIESLRELKNLRWLGFRADTRNQVGSTPVELFWERWPGMAWSRSLNESGTDYTASQGDDGFWSVTINSKEFNDCSVFKGAAIRELTLQDTSVSDLSPLVGLGLTKLNLQKTGVTDLSPLQGMPLKELNLYNTKVSNLTALRDMPLYYLALGETQVTDLSPLEGIPLAKLHLAGTQVADISALRGMPLVEIRMPWCSQITNLSPLAQCSTLTSITLPPNAEKLEFLRYATSLRRISYTEDAKTHQPDKAPNKFWKEYDDSELIRRLREAGIIIRSVTHLKDGDWKLDLSKTAITSLTPLRGMRIKSLNLEQTKVSDLRPLAGMPLEDLDLINTRVTDISPLKGAPLKKLQLNNTFVADLEPLRGMPLTTLSIPKTKVTSLQPLNGMPLEILTLSDTDVTDLSVLPGMPLKTLKLSNCAKLTDLSPLAAAKDLTELGLPPNAKDIGFLRDFPKLKRLSYAVDPDNDWRPDKTALEFWKAHDARKNP
jgi:eukaryotic-like serine/threonine-protein kinase